MHGPILCIRTVRDAKPVRRSHVHYHACTRTLRTVLNRFSVWLNGTHCTAPTCNAAKGQP